MNMLELAPTGPVAVRTKGVVKHYGKRRALDGLDLIVPEQGIYLLAGPNGAGKSTALRLLLNLESANRGAISVLGHAIPQGAAQARARIGYLAEDGVSPYAWLTVGGLIRHHAQYYPTWDHDYASRLIAELEIDLTPRVRHLSRGQTRRVAFVLALAHRPALLLLDEPTDGLDPLVRERVLRRLAEHAAESPTTMLISTHLVQEVERLADHVGILKGGRLVAQITRDRLRLSINRFRFDAPAAWTPPDTAPGIAIRKTVSGRENEWTVLGDLEAVRDLLDRSGTEVRSIQPVTLTDAVVALLEMERAS